MGLDDLEKRNHRCNLRLVILPEKVEGKDAANFLEKWLTEEHLPFQAQ